MTKAAKSAPPLRYPGFTNDWKKQRLDAVTARIQDGTHFSPPLLDEGQYRYISARNIRNGEMLLHDMQYVDEEHHRDIYKRSDVKFGDVLLTKDGASTGNVCLNELHEEFSLLSSVAFIRADEVNSTNEFIYQYLFSPYGQSEVRSVIAGQAITRITLEKLRAFRFAFPTLPEQQKIAAFLGAVDRKIQKLKRKQELLERYKKGVVQQLFSQELRFKKKDGTPSRGASATEGGEYPEWEEKRLGDICSTFKSGEGITADQIDIGGEYPVYGGNGLRGFTDSFTHDGFHLLIGRQGALCGNINRVRGKVYISEHAIAVQCDKSSNTEWLAQLLTYMNLNRLSESSAQPGLAVNKLVQLKVAVPSLEEQSRIAGFLMALDAKVSGVAQAVEAAQKWKKGLLQQMFV